MMIYPAVYGAIFAATGSYSTGFLFAAAPSFLAFLIFIRPPIQGAWISSIGANLVRAAQPIVLLQAVCILGLGVSIGVAWDMFS